MQTNSSNLRTTTPSHQTPRVQDRHADPIRIFVDKDRLAKFWFLAAVAVLVGASIDRIALAKTLKERERVVIIDPAGTFYVSPLLQFQEAPFVGVVERHDAHGMAPQAGGEKRPAVGIRGQTGRNERLQAVAHADRAVPLQQARVEGPGVDDFRFAAAGEQRLAVRREAQAVECLIDRHAAGDPLPIALERDDGDFMRAESCVQCRQPLSAGMQGQIDGEIAEQYLLADRPQRPLVG